MPSELLKCRVCGLLQASPPWGDDDATPSFEICDCCGVEFGYEDTTRASVARYRESWLKAGARWQSPRMRPESWNVYRQLEDIPLEWR